MRLLAHAEAAHQRGGGLVAGVGAPDHSVQSQLAECNAEQRGRCLAGIPVALSVGVEDEPDLTLPVLGAAQPQRHVADDPPVGAALGGEHEAIAVLDETREPGALGEDVLGLGWLMAKYGLAADNLLAVELVTADGDVLDVTEKSAPDLFWALRGGGGNFGVATTFTYRLEPLEMVTGGLIAHPFAAAPQMLRFYREAAAACNDDTTVFAAVVHAPDGSGTKLAAMIVFHTGEAEQAERDLAPFKAWGSPLVAEVGRMPYPVMNTILDAGYPPGALNYWLSSFTRGLTDGLIDTVVEQFASVPSPMTVMLLEHFHGAVTRVGVTDTAVPHRTAGWNLVLPSVWMDPAATDENIAWTRKAHSALAPHLDQARWLNYLDDDQGGDAVRAAYGPNYARLVEVKRRYDPENIFHHNHNIPPS
jgi:FAD/FMN-containing dehydrogenase